MAIHVWKSASRITDVPCVDATLVSPELASARSSLTNWAMVLYCETPARFGHMDVVIAYFAARSGIWFTCWGVIAAAPQITFVVAGAPSESIAFSRRICWLGKTALRSMQFAPDEMSCWACEETSVAVD